MNLLPLPALCALLLASVVGQAATRKAAPMDERVQGWRSDIDFLLEAIQREHYVYRSKPLPEASRSRAKELKSAVSRISDEQVFAELLRLMTSLGDGHCYVAPSQPFMQKMPLKQLPLRMYWFTDGLFVIDTDPGNEHWIGRRITRLGSISTDDAMRRVVDYVPADNRHTSRVFGPIFLGFRSILEALGQPPNAVDIVLQFAAPGGGLTEERIGFIPMRKLSQPERKLVASRVPGAAPAPLYLKNVRSHFWFEVLPHDKTVYFQFNQVWDAPAESIGAFSNRLDAYLLKQQPQLLVVDVRHNNGGDASLLEPLVIALEDFERRNPAAKLVVITGQHTFSAAQIFIAQVDHETKAVFAGEPSGSKPNFVGEDNLIQMPWSGLQASISNRYHETIPGDTREWIEPEVKVELSSHDYFANRDPVMEAVLDRFASRQK